MIQKLINVLALASFAVSGAVVGVSAYVYANKDTLIQELLPLPDLDLPVPSAELPADVTPLPVTPALPSF
jgi:hypothetical protein